MINVFVSIIILRVFCINSLDMSRFLQGFVLFPVLYFFYDFIRGALDALDKRTFLLYIRVGLITVALIDIYQKILTPLNTTLLALGFVIFIWVNVKVRKNKKFRIL